MSGLASFGIAVWEAYKKQSIREKIFWVIGGICLLVAFDQAWQDEHRNADAVISEKASFAGIANTCAVDKRILESANSSLQLQLNNRDGNLTQADRHFSELQQSINKSQALTSDCLILLGKKDTLPDVKLTLSLDSIDDSDFKMGRPKDMAVFVLSNREVTSPRVLLECNRSIDLVGGGVIVGSGATLRSPGDTRRSRRSLLISIVSPSLTPEHPLFVPIRYTPNYDGEQIGCSVMQQ